MCTFTTLLIEIRKYCNQISLSFDSQYFVRNEIIANMREMQCIFVTLIINGSDFNCAK